MSIETMKQALEALEYDTRPETEYGINTAITALRKAIAEAEKQDGDCQQCGGKGCVACDAREQEPVAWMFEFPDKRVAPKFDSAPHGGNWQPLYIHPQPKREWVGLTDEDIEAAYWQTNPSLERFAHAIEAKLKEKNT